MARSASVADALRLLLPEREQLIEAIVTELYEEIPELTEDDRMRSLVAAAVSENVTSVMHAIANEARFDTIGVPAAGIAQARVQAQRDIPVTVLLRAYRLGQTRFLEGAFSRLQEQTVEVGPATMELVRLVGRYIDRVSEQVVQAYEEERELRVGSKAALRQYWVNQLLAEDSPEAAQAEAALGYRLGMRHVAVEVWLERELDEVRALAVVDRVTTLLRRAVTLRGEVLVVPTDALRTRIWLQVGEEGSLDVEAVAAELVEAELPVRLAVGDPRFGAAGFRATAASARRVKALCTAVGAGAPQVLAHAQVAPLMVLTEDPGEIATFVERTLRGLASPDPRNAGLRETLLVYLESNRKHHEAASRLHVHRNTVHYRVQQAVEALGGELGTDTLALQLALTICRWREPERR